MSACLRIVLEYFRKILDFPVLNGLNFFRCEPPDLLAVFPNAILLLPALFRDKYTETVLLPLIPPAGILLLVGPGVDAIAVFFVISVVALVHATILPSVDPEIIHDVTLPVPEVATTVTPLVMTIACDLIILPLALVNGAVCPEILADAILASLRVLTGKFGRIRP